MKEATCQRASLSLIYALLSAENKGIQLVHISWIIISLCKIVCNVCRLNRQRVVLLSGIMQICEIFSVNDV